LPDDPGGEKFTVKLSVLPGLSVALLGGFDTVNGNTGAVKPVIATGFAETFLNVTTWWTTGPPIGWIVKLAEVGVAVSRDEALRPWPLSVTTAVGPVLLAVSVPLSAPMAFGVKVIGTVIVCPADNVAGKGRVGVPMLNAALVSVNDETVVEAVAVNVAVDVVDCETILGEKLTLVPVSEGVGKKPKPKPMSAPSLVPFSVPT
jgi:hypothetical protein